MFALDTVTIFLSGSEIDLNGGAIMNKMVDDRLLDYRQWKSDAKSISRSTGLADPNFLRFQK